MPLDKLVCGLLETTVNKLQQLDSSALQRRKQLNGTIIGVALKEINKPLYFVISTQQIDILSEYEGQADCFIRLNISALKELQNNHQLTHLIKTEQLEVDGDIQVVQRFARLLTEMDIDWEEHFSGVIGDVLAHKLYYQFKQCRQNVSSQFKKIEKHSAEYLIEELKIAPGPLEVVYFCEQVNDLKKQTDDLEKRLQRCFASSKLT
ncbi:MAG: ubiquinone biosynthesis protein UbiJ [Psychromonas sp.]|jgi:ubiquinone biosynthesis protein UbiJ|uniref:ubiquinone biosynthesis accessory factor UbiJ n=1 Tax=Psychromonas sp. TaxID=1884585 RepID=UPI0039E50493